MRHAGHAPSARPSATVDWSALDRVVATVAPLKLADPVLVSPPATVGGKWTAKSDTQNRTLRSDLTVDGETGQILSRVDFGQREIVDRIVGIGVAAHERHLFGWINQLISLLTALGLIIATVSALVFWWRRRPAGVVGAPQILLEVAPSTAVVSAVIGLAVLLPLLGASLILVFAAERLILRRLPASCAWLGLRHPGSA